MPATNAQIINQALQISKALSYTTQAEVMYNSILEALALEYDFDAQKVPDYVLTIGNISTNNGAGPYNLPADYLRASYGEANYLVSGQPYILEQIPMYVWRAQFMGAGVQNYPQQFASDTDPSDPLRRVVYFYNPPNGAYNVTFPYFKKHAFIDDAATSDDFPWFQGSDYLYTKLAAELMKIMSDDRQQAFESLATTLLKKYLELKDDPEGYAITIKDGAGFGGQWDTLRPTKQTVW